MFALQLVNLPFGVFSEKGCRIALMFLVNKYDSENAKGIGGLSVRRINSRVYF